VKITIAQRSYPLQTAFTIARGSRMTAEVIEVTIAERGVQGRGECVPYARYGESLASVTDAITALALPIDRSLLQNLLPAGAARNAVDCALWDLEARQRTMPVWQLAGLDAPHSANTAFTISLAEPDGMAAQARRHAACPRLKIKLGPDRNSERIAAVREAAPDTRMIIDANEAWTIDVLQSCQQTLRDAAIEMIEQPLPAGEDQPLADIQSAITLCADESCHDRASLERLSPGYGMINVKLDKTGGLTEALALCREARQRNLRIMVGCMLGSSLAMAPALLLAQDAEYVDLDGPLHLVSDIDNGLHYEDTTVHPASAHLWGGGSR